MNPTQTPQVSKLTPTLNPLQIRQNIDALKNAGKQTPEIQAYVDNYTKGADGNYTLKSTSPAPVSPAPSTPIVSNPMNDINKAGEDVHAAITGTGNYEGQNPIQRGVAAASGAALAIPNVVADVIPGGKSALNAVTGAFGAATNAAGNIGNILADISQKIGLMSPEQRAQYDKANAEFVNSQVGKTTTDVATTLQNLGNIANTILMAKGGAEGIQKTVDVVPEVIGKAKNVVTPKLVPPEVQAAKTNEYVLSQYNKAIKPGVSGKSAPGQIEKYNANVPKAVQTIVDNKPNLKVTDEYGEPTGKLPQTVDQFRQAIDQTKSGIFKQYDAMAQAAGDKGAVVDLNPAVTELDKVVNNKVVQDLHPDLAAYAKTRADALRARGQYTTSEAQDAVQNLNKSLDAFYKNPSYETASRASVDSLIANQIRVGLDASIEGAGAPGYQALRSQYATLKAIEQDVTKRGIVEARRAGMSRGMTVGDVVSAEELVRGLATLNPAALATAGMIKGIAVLRNYLTSPNRAIRLMFEKADATNTARTSSQPTTPQVPLQSQVENASPESIAPNSPKVQGGTPNMQGISPELQPLAEEAKKYKSAEEFVKAQRQAFHGTSVAGLDEIGLGSGPRSNSFMGTTREVKSGAVFFTPDKSVADFFAQNRTEFMQDLGKKGTPTTYERYLNIKNPLDLTGKNLAKTSAALDKLGIDIEGKLTGMQSFNRDLATLIDDKEVTPDELWKLADDPKIVEALKKAGYDGAIFKETGNRGTSYAIFDPKQAFTKSQLTDFYNKVRGKTSKQ